MLNGIWMAMIVLAFVGTVCTGRWTALSAAAADGARQAVETVLLLLGAMCLWTGIMRIAGEAGLTNGLSKILSPVIKRLFPNYGKNETVREKISMNIAANMLGMGNAATPFGLSAMDELVTGVPGFTNSGLFATHHRDKHRGLAAVQHVATNLRTQELKT